MTTRERIPLDLRCYVITADASRRSLDAAAAAAAAGAGVVQVRAKQATTAELLAFTIAVADAVAVAGPATRVLVDDSAEVAFAARCHAAAVHGVHLGADDLPPRDARALLGPDAVIGVTTGTAELVAWADGLGDVIDYAGCGPFRRTPTKQATRPTLGLDGYPALVSATTLPLVAIGDVTPHDVGALRATGVAGVALVRAVMDADDPGAVVRRVLDEWDGSGRDGSGRNGSGRNAPQR